MEDGTPVAEKEYDLFISYSTDPDYALSRKVEAFLESFHKLKTPENLKLKPLAVCRDGSDFSLHTIKKRGAEKFEGEDYVKEILEAYLSKSKYLLVLCSKNAALSEYVQFEIDWFMRNMGVDFILLAVTEGDDIKLEQTKIFPEIVIQYKLQTKPFYDLRGFKNESKAWKKVRDYEEELTNIAAFLNNESGGRLLPLWKKEEIRKGKRIKYIASSTVAAFLLIIFLFGYSIYSRNKTERIQSSLAYWDKSQSAQYRNDYLSSLFYTSMALGLSDENNQVQKLLYEIQPSVSQVYLRYILAGNSPVTNTIFNSNGQHVLIYNKDGSVRIFDVQSGQLIGHKFKYENAKKIICSPDGNQVVILTQDQKVDVVDIQTGKGVKSFLNGLTQIENVIFRPDGKQILSIDSTGVLHAYDYQSGKTVDSFKSKSKIITARYSPDSKRLVLFGNRLVAYLLNAESGWKMLQTFTIRSLNIAVDFSSDGKTLLITDSRNVLRILNAQSGETINLIKYKSDIADAYLKADGRAVLSLHADGAFRICDEQTGKEIYTNFKFPHISKVSFSPDFKYIVTVNTGGSFQLWDEQSGKALSSIFSFPNTERVLFSPDSKCMLVESKDGTVHVLEIKLENSTEVDLLHSENVQIARFSPDGTQIMTTENGKVRFWNTQNGQVTDSLENDFHERDDGVYVEQRFNSAVYSPEGKQIITATEDGIIFWDAATHLQQAFAPKIRNSKTVLLADISSDGKFVASVSETEDYNSSDTVCIWDLYKGKNVYNLKHGDGVNYIAFGSSGELLVTASYDNTLHLWDLGSGKELFKCKFEKGIKNADISVDGKYLIGVTEDSKMYLWSVGSEREIIPLPSFSNDVNYAVFSPDGKRLLTLNDDSTARLWDIQTRRQIRQVYRLEGLGYFAAFNMDDDKFLTANEKGETKGVVNLWETGGGDLDVTPDLFKLQAAVISGTRFNYETNEITWIPYNEWVTLKDKYNQLASKHFETCQYPKYNLWNSFNTQQGKKIQY